MPSAARLPTFVIPIAFLAAIGLALAIVSLGPARLLPWLGSALFGLVLLWVATTIFWPARADRTCPACRKETLVRLDPATTQGVRCSACGHADPSATSWFLAEEEGPLEDLVLAERRRKKGGGGN